jgi:hypothetical protein
MSAMSSDLVNAGSNAADGDAADRCGRLPMRKEEAARELPPPR